MECYCTNCNAKNPRFFVIRKTDDNCDLCWGPLRPRAVKPVPHPPNIVEFKKKVLNSGQSFHLFPSHLNLEFVFRYTF